jgi:hypothetical protein
VVSKSVINRISLGIVITIVALVLFVCVGPPLTERGKAYQFAEDAVRREGWGTSFSGYYDEEATSITLVSDSAKRYMVSSYASYGRGTMSRMWIKVVEKNPQTGELTVIKP